MDIQDGRWVWRKRPRIARSRNDQDCGWTSQKESQDEWWNSQQTAVDAIQDSPQESQAVPAYSVQWWMGAVYHGVLQGWWCHWVCSTSVRPEQAQLPFSFILDWTWWSRQTHWFLWQVLWGWVRQRRCLFTTDESASDWPDKDLLVSWKRSLRKECAGSCDNRPSQFP